MDRIRIERLLRELYAARVRGDLDEVCRTFSQDAKFRISGTSHGSSIHITAVGTDEIRQWMSLLIQSFELTEYNIQSIVIDYAKAAVHWRTNVHSRITGTRVLTELIALVEIRQGRIVSYTEFFVSYRPPCSV
jgi:ketosteroid isomerase-like protein